MRRCGSAASALSARALHSFLNRNYVPKQTYGGRGVASHDSGRNFPRKGVVCRNTTEARLSDRTTFHHVSHGNEITRMRRKAPCRNWNRIAVALAAVLNFKSSTKYTAGPGELLLHSDNSHLADSTRLGLVTCVSSVRWPHVTADINTVRVQLACSVSMELKLLRIRHLAVRRATAFRFAFCGGTPQD
jgi:hypothetical protein